MNYTDLKVKIRANLEEDQRICSSAFVVDRNRRKNELSYIPGLFGVVIVTDGDPPARFFDVHNLEAYTRRVRYDMEKGYSVTGDLPLALFHVSLMDRTIIERLLENREGRNIGDYQ